MLLLLAAAASATTLPPPKVRVLASASARATIRILQPVRLRVGAHSSIEGLPARQVLLRTADGGQQPARLVELE